MLAINSPVRMKWKLPRRNSLATAGKRVGGVKREEGEKEGEEEGGRGRREKGV